MNTFANKTRLIRLGMLAAMTLWFALPGFAAALKSQVTHGPTFPPNPWTVMVTHGPTFPPNPWCAREKHGPTFPPNPWTLAPGSGVTRQTPDARN
jgi:hypothetical protein